MTQAGHIFPACDLCFLFFWICFSEFSCCFVVCRFFFDLSCFFRFVMCLAFVCVFRCVCLRFVFFVRCVFCIYAVSQSGLVTQWCTLRCPPVLFLHTQTTTPKITKWPLSPRRALRWPHVLRSFEISYRGSADGGPKGPP